MGHVQVPNSALLFAVGQTKQPSLVTFGDRGWEASLLHQRDQVLDPESVALGVMIAERLFQREQQLGREYTDRLRRLLTVCLVPLYHFGRMFTLLESDDFEVVEALYPPDNPEIHQSLLADATTAMQGANPLWRTMFSRMLVEAKLDSADERFLLLTFIVAFSDEDQFRAMHEQQEQERAAPKPMNVTLNMKREEEKKVPIEPIKPRWTLEDIGGCYEAKRRITDLIWLMLRPHAVEAWGRNLPTGALIAGPPGTGKTMLVHALASATGRPLIVASMADIFTKWYGESTQRVRNLFVAVKKSGGILFLDEADGVVSSRGARATHEESVRVVNEFCKQMEALPTDGSTLVVLATNFQSNLDEAAVRAKRIDLIITIDHPDERERLSILRVHVEAAQKKAGRELFVPEINWASISKMSAGLSGADLAAIVDRALLRKATLQARTDKPQSPVTAHELADALDQQRHERTKDAHAIGFDAHSESP